MPQQAFVTRAPQRLKNLPDEEDSGLAIGVNKALLEWQLLPETYSDTNLRTSFRPFR
jgi:hypothetical protein